MTSWFKNMLDELNLKIKEAEKNLVATLLQKPDKNIINNINIEPVDFKQTINGGGIFSELKVQLNSGGFNLGKLSEKFGTDLIKAYLDYPADHNRIHSNISFIKAGVDLSHYHLRSHLGRYKAEVDKQLKLPLNERVFKPSLLNLERAIGGYYRGEMSVLAARPGLGKSSLALQECLHLGTMKRPTAYIILEMTSSRQIDRMIVRESDHLLFREIIELSYAKDPIKQKDWQRSFRNLHYNELYLIGSNKERDISDYKNLKPLILNLLKMGVRFFVIDSINLMHWSEVNAKRHYELESIVKDIVNTICINEDFGKPHIQLIAHLNREVEKTADKRGRLDHLRDTGGLEQWADLVQFIYRDMYADGDEANIAEIYSLKNRNAAVPGLAKALWDGGKFRFLDLLMDKSVVAV